MPRGFICERLHKRTKGKRSIGLPRTLGEAVGDEVVGIALSTSQRKEIGGH